MDGQHVLLAPTDVHQTLQESVALSSSEWQVTHVCMWGGTFILRKAIGKLLFRASYEQSPSSNIVCMLHTAVNSFQS